MSARSPASRLTLNQNRAVLNHLTTIIHRHNRGVLNEKGGHSGITSNLCS